MVETLDISFSELVNDQLSSEESQSLWALVSQEFDRVDGGPDAARESLEAERQRLEERVKNLLSQINPE